MDKNLTVRDLMLIRKYLINYLDVNKNILSDDDLDKIDTLIWKLESPICWVSDK